MKQNFKVVGVIFIVLAVIFSFYLLTNNLVYALKP